MSAFARVIASRPRAWLAVMIAITALATAGIGRLRFDSSLASMTVHDDPERVFHEQTEALFGQEEIGVIALVVDDAYSVDVLTALQGLTTSVGKVPGVARALSLSTASDVAADVLTPPPLMPRGQVTEATIRRLRERVPANPSYVPHLVARDGRAVAINVFFEKSLDAAATARVDAEISAIVGAYTGPGKIYFTGVSHIQARAVQSMRADLVRFLPLSLLCMMLVLWLTFHSFRALVLPLISISLGVAELLGVMGWLNTPITLATLVLPSLLLVIGGSYAVHMTAVVLEREEKDGHLSVEAVLHQVGLPIIVSSVTTAIGFGSLAFHPIPAIATLGLFAAIGVALTTIGVLIGLPLTFAALPARPRAGSGSAERSPDAAGSFVDRVVAAAARLGIDRRYWVYAASAVAAVVALTGAVRVRVDTNLLSAFRASSDVREAHRAIAENLAGASPISIVITGPDPDYFKSIVSLRRLKDLQQFIQELEGVDATISLLDYLDAIDRGLQATPGELEVGPDGEVKAKASPKSIWEDPANQLPEVLKVVELSKETFSGVVDAKFQRIRITARTSIMGSNEVVRLAREIESYARAMFPPGVDVHTTGNLVVVSSISEGVLIGQVQSIGIAFGVIFIVLAIMFLSTRVGLAAMIPNVLPVVIFFGVMGWSGVELNLATSIIAAVALGIAVDDTIHCMARLNAQVKTAQTQRDALLGTMVAVGRRVVAATLTLTAGFLVLSFSEFAIIGDFGWLSAMTMLVALVTNLVLLPAILATVPVISVWDLVAFRLGESPHLTIPLFHGLGGLAVRLVVLLGTLRTFERGQAIVRKGEAGHEMYLVITGCADVLAADGQAIIATLTRGDVFGEMALLRASPRVADVIAREPVEALVIDEAFLKRLRNRYPRVASRFFINIARILSDRLERANRRLALVN